MFTPLQKTVYIHAVTCMISSFITLFFVIVEVALTNYVTTCPIDANVTTLVVIGQAMSFVAPVSMLSLTAQMKRRLGRLLEEAVSTVTMLIIIALLAIMNVPPIVQACYNSTVIAMEAWVWIIVYTTAIAVSLPLYAGAVCVFVLPALIDEDERAKRPA